MVQTQEQQDVADYYLGNNVEVAPDVVIAPGAVLDAAPGSRLVIEAGACIGSGVVIQVYGGDLTLGSGVNVGKEVLLVGTGQIGARACIGAESTLMNPQVAADAVVSARSLIGDNGRLSQASSNSGRHPDVTSQNGQGFAPEPQTASEGDLEGKPDANKGESNHQGEAADTGTLSAANMVYGREQVMQLVKTLFPHRDMLNGNGQNSS